MVSDLNNPNWPEKDNFVRDPVRLSPNDIERIIVLFEKAVNRYICEQTAIFVELGKWVNTFGVPSPEHQKRIHDIASKIDKAFDNC